MMEQNLKLFLSILVCSLSTSACQSQENKALPSTKRQVVVVVDKSKSVTYDKKIADVRKWLKSQFEAVYKNSLRNIQYSKFIIDHDTRVFPKTEAFEEECKYPEPETRTEQLWADKWNDNKRRWIKNHVEDILQVVQQVPSSNQTDIFSIFEGLDLVQKTNGPWDELNVFIFSDMVHTKGSLNISEITLDNALNKGKEAGKQLLRQGRLSKANIINLRLIIYTPDNTPESNKISLYWKGFFEEWGLKSHQYQFKS